MAAHLIQNHPTLTEQQLNGVIQQTIDRIIFLRICEDRGIEDYGRLLSLTNGHHIYQRLFELFVEADERYNSDLFHFKAEKGGVLNLSQFMGLFFTLFLFPQGGMVGKRAVKSRFILSSLATAIPPYQSNCKL